MVKFEIFRLFAIYPDRLRRELSRTLSGFVCSNVRLIISFDLQKNQLLQTTRIPERRKLPVNRKVLFEMTIRVGYGSRPFAADQRQLKETSIPSAANGRHKM
jgi:hypothetical protein